MGTSSKTRYHSPDLTSVCLPLQSAQPAFLREVVARGQFLLYYSPLLTACCCSAVVAVTYQPCPRRPCCCSCCPARHGFPKAANAHCRQILPNYCGRVDYLLACYAWFCGGPACLLACVSVRAAEAAGRCEFVNSVCGGQKAVRGLGAWRDGKGGSERDVWCAWCMGICVWA